MTRMAFPLRFLSRCSISVGSSEPAEAKMSCANVKGRWQVCGEVKPWTRFVAGVGIRFNKQGQRIRAR